MVHSNHAVSDPRVLQKDIKDLVDGVPSEPLSTNASDKENLETEELMSVKRDPLRSPGLGTLRANT